MSTLQIIRWIFMMVVTNFRKKKTQDYYITLTINADGADVSKSKKHGSLWPIQGIINELTPKVRFDWNNLLLIGIWFGSDPDMAVYLRPLIEEVKATYEVPIEFKIYESVVQINIAPLIFPVDSVARCWLQEKSQYNGYFGCGYCLHPGK
jgi:hypothetical protein